MWRQIRKRRGKPPTGKHKYKDRRILLYLARIAFENNVNAHDFFTAILEAWNNQESECNQLVIRCREKTQDAAIFLFTVGKSVIGQFPIPATILQGKNRLKEYMDVVSAKASAKKFVVSNPKIKDLKVGMKKVNLTAEVVEIPKPTIVYSKWGNEAFVSNVLVADDTGSIRMSLWNQQITMISQGDKIQIEKGKVTVYRGERQLRIGRYGSFSVVE